jgi:hypothetical protein
MGKRRTYIVASINAMGNGGTGPLVPVRKDFVNIENIDISVGHPGWRWGGGDRGGPFLQTSLRYEISPGHINHTTYVGPYVVDGSLGDPPYWSTAGPTPNSSLFGMGATAISRCMPTNPAFDMSTAIGEVTNDGLPHVIGSSAFKSQVRTAKKAGDEYLNYEFGWLPLVSDLRKFAHAVKHRHEIMQSFIKGSDRKIRRGYEIPRTPEGYYPKSSSFNSIYYINTTSQLIGTTHVTDSADSHQWFKGAFRYHVPVSVSHGNKAAYWYAESKKILGLELTPEVVWNLAPWSWAIDWFTNTGDVMHNISRLGKDGLVLEYGYIMCNNFVERSIAFEPIPSLNASNSFYRRRSESKQRIPATPYGFNLSYGGLSSTQQAVITALGLSRAF